MEKAAAASGYLSSNGQRGAFQGMREAGSDSKSRPTLSRERHRGIDEELPIRHNKPTGEKATRESRAPAGTYPNRREEIPRVSHSQTMPTQKPFSQRAAVKTESPNLKHTEAHETGYGSSSSPHTLETREEKPPRHSTRPTKTATKYQVVDDSDSNEDWSQYIGCVRGNLVTPIHLETPRRGRHDP